MASTASYATSSKIANSSTSFVEMILLALDCLCCHVWYGRLKLLFTMSVKIDGQEEPVDIECAYVSFCYEIKLEPSGTY